MAALTLEDIQQVSDEIRHLVRAGMPLEQTLADAGRGRGRRLQELTRTISEGLQQGRSLQDIIEDQSAGPPRMLAAAVGAGVQSGDLGLTVELMGDFASDIVDLRSRLAQSAAYPLTIAAVAGLLVMLVIQHALVRFYDAIVLWGIETHPWLQALLEWNQAYPGWTLIMPLAGFCLLIFWMASGRASAMAFKGPERLVFLLPGVWALVRDLQNYTLTRMLSLLTERGLPLQDALMLAGTSSGATRLETACNDAATRIKQGQAVVSYDAGGRQSGRRLPSLLAACLKQVEHDERRMVHRLRSVAEFYRSRLVRNLTWIRLLMPVLMFLVIAGGCVLTYATLVFWPVSELYRNLGG
jgi:type II secretory pathway component PulF